MQMLHGGDAGPDHLKGGIKRIEVGVHIARHHARDEPKLQRHIGGAQLHRRQPDMVMRIDKARQHDLPPRPHHRDMRMLAAQIIIGADFGDDAIFLDQRAIGDFLPSGGREGFGDHGAAAHQGNGHGGFSGSDEISLA